MEDIVKTGRGFGAFDLPYDRADVVFLGVPLDMTSSYRSGYKTAPSRIRDASVHLETYLPSLGLDVFEKLNITDVGDVVVVPGDMTATGERITRTVGKILGNGKIPFLLGGEHTVTYFSLMAFQDVFVVHLDAHSDLRNEYMGDPVCHATVLRRALDKMSADRLVQVGIRSCSKEEAEFAKEAGVKSYSSEDFMDDPKGVAEGVIKAADGRKVYMTIDLDILDPAFAPGVATPEPGGPSSAEVLRLVRNLGERLDLVGCDIVELVPPYDNETTAFAAARIAYEVLGTISKKR